MLLVVVVFLFVVGVVLGGYATVTYLPGMMEARQMNRRLREVSTIEPIPGELDSTVVRRTNDGPLPAVDRVVSRTRAGARLARLIEQSGVPLTPSAVAIMSVVAAAAGGLAAAMFVRQPYVWPI